MTGMYEQYYLVFGGEGYTPIKQTGQKGFHTSGALKLEELYPPDGEISNSNEEMYSVGPEIF